MLLNKDVVEVVCTDPTREEITGNNGYPGIRTPQPPSDSLGGTGQQLDRKAKQVSVTCATG